MSADDSDNHDVGLSQEDPNKAAKAQMVGAGKAIEAAFPGLGFALFVIARGDDGSTELRYVSNVNRLHLAKTLEDFAYKLKVKIN